MVVQDIKASEVRIFVNLRKLNDACMHDIFLTPFTDEVLEGVGGLVGDIYHHTHSFGQIGLVKPLS